MESVILHAAQQELRPPGTLSIKRKPCGTAFRTVPWSSLLYHVAVRYASWSHEQSLSTDENSLSVSGYGAVLLEVLTSKNTGAHTPNGQSDL